jgi:hypothetical protein
MNFIDGQHNIGHIWAGQQLSVGIGEEQERQIYDMTAIKRLNRIFCQVFHDETSGMTAEISAKNEN